MSGALQAVFQNQRSFVLPLAIGAAYEGGFFAGQISTAGNGVADYNLVVGPLSTAQISNQWKNETTATAGADSNINGPQNTADMVADGNSTVYPCAHFCNNLSTGGKTDWYMPAINELEVCYFNLKPTTTSNDESSGINPNSVPARASYYTAGNPAQTSAADFKNTGAEDFAADSYWTSTEFSATQARAMNFDYGSVANAPKFYSGITRFVRAVRRVAV